MEKSLNKNPILTNIQHFKIIWVFSLFTLLGILFPNQAFSSNLYGQQVIVTDAKTGEPLIGVSVFTDDLGFSGTTDLDGKVTLDKVGHLEIVNFSYIGYETLKIPFKLTTVDCSTVLKTVKGMENKLTEGLDGMSNKFIKSIINSIAAPLTTVINKSLTEGIFPDEMKLAKIIPLFKSGNEKLPNNYRPLSILATLSKVL